MKRTQKIWSFTILTACFYYLLSHNLFAAESENEVLVSQVRAHEIAFAQTMQDRDFEAFLSFVSSEAIFFNGNEALRGRNAVAQAWAPLFENEQAPFSWKPDLVQVLDSGTLAISSGPVTGPNGEDFGRFNSIWRKESDGQWRVVFDKGS
jgi:ketosteroid isomerase-like protein